MYRVTPSPASRGAEPGPIYELSMRLHRLHAVPSHLFALILNRQQLKHQYLTNVNCASKTKKTPEGAFFVDADELHGRIRNAIILPQLLKRRDVVAIFP